MTKQIKRLVTLALAAVLLISCMAISAFADGTGLVCGASTVTADKLNIRSSAGLDGKIIGSVGENSIVVIIEKTNADWNYINFNGVVGYVSTDYLTEMLVAENFLATGTVTKTDVRMRESHSTDSRVICSLKSGTAVDVIGVNTGWFKVKIYGKTGYIRSDLMEITGAPSVSGANGDASAIGTRIADYALQYVGYSYVYGSASPSVGFDCSGLTSYVFGQFGYTIQRTASQQYRTAGTAVSKSELIAGDLVFFSSNGSTVTHVGIYIGDDKFVHASTSNTGVIISDLNSSYYTRVWYGAKRVA